MGGATEAGRSTGSQKSGTRGAASGFMSRGPATDREGAEARTRGAGLRDWPVDFVARSAPDRARVRGEVPSRPGVADSAPVGVELPASGGGSRSVGRRLKKSPERRPHHRLCRRKRTERTPAPLSHLGAEGTNTGVAVSLQLEDVVGDGRGNVVELLLSTVSRRDSQPADHRVSRALAAPPTGQTAHCLGWLARPPQPCRMGLCAPAARTPPAGISSRLRAGTESSRVSVVALETTRTAQLLPPEFWPAQPLCPQGPSPDAPATFAGDRVLATSGTVSVVTILCNS